MKYQNTKKVDGNFEQVLEMVKKLLAEQGFGILSEINVSATLKKKLDVDYENYTILGACNPEFAYKALQEEKEVGLLLPCNVIVYQVGIQVFVSVIVASMAMGIIDNPKLLEIANEVDIKLSHVINSL